MDKATSKNSREFTRVSVHVAARVKAGETEIVTKQTRDLSMKGVFLDSDDVLPVGTECDISLFLDGLEPPVKVEMKGTVERATDLGMAIEFHEIGLDSYEHLRHLVMHNSTNSSVVEKEIKDHLGLKKRG